MKHELKSFKRPEICLKIIECPTKQLDVWSIFGFDKHHYLTEKQNKGARVFVALWNERPIALCSILAFPNRNFKNAWRGHRLVVLPDFQGLGIGVAMSEWVGEKMLEENKRYFCKTANIKLGDKRNKSLKWRGTTKNGKKRKDYGVGSTKNQTKFNNLEKHIDRVCYSHEYIGIT